MNSLVCRRCDASYPLDERIWRCGCGGMLDVSFEAAFHLGSLPKRPRTMWRYREAIPVADESAVVSFQEGWTPLTDCEIGGIRVHLKHDYLFPSGSFKDRGASVLVSRMKELGVTSFHEDSSGNAGSALAAYAAAAGIGCTIYLPESTPDDKKTQILLYGAKVVTVSGPRRAAADAALEAGGESFYGSHVWNPFFFQGTKTVAYEICEQLYWSVPDTL
ncbi:MAG: pyridoxal-phosphate dependent enzyme, partial [Candidatus Latescibacteria bacterium]|nr:pyridoxal-phosphate dependent enzyme [Candidatus Latescibacterota bacterium]